MAIWQAVPCFFKTRSGRNVSRYRSFYDGMDPAASSLRACSHSQPRLGLLRQFVAWYGSVISRSIVSASPKLRRPGLAQMRGPSRLNLGDHTHTGLHRGGAARGDANQARTTIPADRAVRST